MNELDKDNFKKIMEMAAQDHDYAERCHEVQENFERIEFPTDKAQ